ncbi:hypothetical protein M885DRAFT_622833 [Pelagophyceae sp. CCMP2097]|nr:hypothetical protein M885DRAFT_622833 [Pelagophyceae sp. CCMP2097]
MPRLAVSALVLAAAGLAEGATLGTCTQTLQTPGRRFGRHRDLVVLQGLAEDARWTAALCCINTYAKTGSKAKHARLVNFDGDGYDYEGPTYAEAAQQAYSEICGMYMGSRECIDNADCVPDALRGGAATTVTASFSAQQRAAEPADNDGANPGASTWVHISTYAAAAFAAAWW